MDFNFYDFYQKKTDAELLAIVKNGYSYQVAAVEAAKKILHERGIDPLEKIEEEIVATSNTTENYDVAEYDKLSDILDYKVEKPVTNFNAILVLVLVKTLTSLFFFCKDLKDLFSYDNSIFLMLNLMGIVLNCLSCYLFFKERKWGWYLVFFDAVYIIGYFLVNMKTWWFGITSGYSIIWQLPYLFLLGINIALVVLCLRRSVLQYFVVSKRDIKITIGIAMIIPLLYLFKKLFIN